MTRKSGSDRYNRRTFIKASAATGAALATGSVFAPAVRAAKTIKLGYVSPQTGPLAAFAEANSFIISNFQNAVKDGIKVGNAAYPVEVVIKDSQSNPNRAAEVAKQLIVDDKVDLVLAASTPENHQPGVDAMRDRGDALRHHHVPVAAVFHRPAGQSGRWSACVEAVQLHLSLFLGT
jgi:branched-chain amino acid transport system substrate-binding protein